jgi:hypothetical protein
MPSARQGRKDARHRHAIGIGNCHHRHAIIGIIIGIIGIGMPSACHHRQQQDAGRQDAAKWRSIVIQILKEC